jgi:hypothetical protein
LLEVPGLRNEQARHKPVIRVVPGDMDRVVDAAEKVLANGGRHYQAGGLIVSVAAAGEFLKPQNHSVLSLVGVERSGAVTETELSDVLVACPRCRAWPMSVNFNRSSRTSPAFIELAFGARRLIGLISRLDHQSGRFHDDPQAGHLSPRSRFAHLKRYERLIA